MPYSINKYDGTVITVVEDGTINNTLDLKLVGKDYPGYGETQNENFVFLLENFAGATAPPRPLSGQIWYDTSNKKIKFYDKTSQKWRSTGGAEISDTPPVGLGVGDMWWDTKELKLYVSSGTSLVHIGPQSVYDRGITQMRSRGVVDVASAKHAVIEVFANGNIENIISSEEFVLHSSVISEYGNRFDKIRKGLNLAYTDNEGVSTVTDTKYWGTASDSDRLGGKLAEKYLTTDSLQFKDDGFTVGDHQDLKVFINNGVTPTIKNQLSSDIHFYVQNNSQTICPLLISGPALLPGTTAVINIGSSSVKFNTVYASTFNGVATNADTLKVGTAYQSGSIGAAANTIAARDASGNITANIFNGVATSARYADLAEKYLPDADYEVGTVMVIGGEKEITASTRIGQRAIGVISENPAYMMNNELEGGVYVALKGRVPVKVHGPVNKGDRLSATNDGVATSRVFEYHNTFAIALESSSIDGIITIEAVIL